MVSNRGLAQLLCMAAILATVAACGETPDGDAGQGADVVLRNGRIYTVDQDRSWAEAIAVSGGRIAYVGSDADTAAFVGKRTRVVDLGGRMLMPGFQDSHIHPIMAGLEAAACDISGLPDLDAVRRAILDCAAADPGAAWVHGSGWEATVFGAGGTPSRTLLDELVPDRPAYFASADAHLGWANSAALAIAGIDRDTPDPLGGRIDRDPETGEAIGSLQERATGLVEQHLPPVSLKDRMDAMRDSVSVLNSWGITSIQDAIVTAPDLDAYHELEQAGELNLRVVASLLWDRSRGMEQIPELIALRDKYPRGLVDTATVKIHQDGVMENYTAAMLEPYLIPSQSRGLPMVEPEKLKLIVARLDAEGFQVHFHAIGDAAVRHSLDAVEAALLDNGQLDHRHHIAHLELIDPADIPRFNDLSVVANFQPLWAYNDVYITELTIPFIGEERARWLYPIRSVVDTGATVAFGSDWSVSTANPFPQIETALTRRSAEDDDRDALFPEERIDLASALAAFTINAAFVNRHEQDTGSIETGKFADFVVLDRNLFEIPVEEISETKVLVTVFGGNAVYGSYDEL